MKRKLDIKNTSSPQLATLQQLEYLSFKKACRKKWHHLCTYYNELYGGSEINNPCLA
jgi:hypothetical protein